MTTWESLAHGASYLAFARRVTGRDTEFLSTVRRSTEQGSRLRRKYTYPLAKPLSVRHLEAVDRRLPLQERRAEGEELVLSSVVPGWWSQEVEGQVGSSEVPRMPSSEPRRVEPARAADMRAAIQRTRASAEARRRATERAEQQPGSPAVRRVGREGPAGEVRPVRRRAQLVEEPDREQAPAPEPTQPMVVRPSSVVAEAETPRQRGGVLEEPAEVAPEGGRAQGAEARPSGPPTARPRREPSAAPTTQSESAAVYGEEAPSSAVEGEEIVPHDVEAEAEEREDLSETSPEPVSREVEGSAIPRIARRRATPDREGPELLQDTEISALGEIEEIRGEERQGFPAEPKVYTRLGVTSYAGNLSPEAVPPRRVSRERVEERRSVPEGPDRLSEEVSRRTPLEESEVTEEVGDRERPIVSPRVRRAAEEGSEEDVRAQEVESSSSEVSIAGVDETPVSRAIEESGASEGRPTLRGERPSAAESAPGADVVRRAPRAVRPETSTDRLVREREEAPSERIKRPDERASVSPEPAMSRDRDAEDVGEGASVGTEGPGPQDVPLEEALFGVSGLLRRARRPPQEEGAGTETSLVLPSISFRSPEARERVSSDQVRRAEDTQAPAEPTAKVGSVEAEAPDLGEEEEEEGVDVGKLADAVYRRIRDRLRIERERYGRRGRW